MEKEKYIIICKFCGSSINETSCFYCGSLTPKRETKNEDTNASFTDYSYNRYQALSAKIYRFWTKFTALTFSQSYFLALLFSPFIGGRPKISFSKNEKFIDVGCGRGEFIKFLPKQWEVSGCDIVDYGKKNILVGNFETMILPRQYSIVRSSHSIEHAMQPKVFLQKLIDITSCGGIIAISSPNPNSLAAKIFGKYWFPLHVESHFCLINPKAVEKYLEDHGCQVLSSGTYTLFSAAGSLARLVSIKQGFFFFLILLLPLSLVEFISNKADSFIIYAKKI